MPSQKTLPSGVWLSEGSTPLSKSEKGSPFSGEQPPSRAWSSADRLTSASLAGSPRAGQILPNPGLGYSSWQLPSALFPGIL